jgi:hypothetical protein
MNIQKPCCDDRLMILLILCPRQTYHWLEIFNFDFCGMDINTIPDLSIEIYPVSVRILKCFAGYSLGNLVGMGFMSGILGQYR